jgi:hypothetical protein
MRHRSIITTVVVTGALAFVPAASAQDLRSPDARDSPRHTSAAFDLRSPDARELAGDGRAQVPVIAHEPGRATTVVVEPDGFDVLDASLGAIAVLALTGAGIVLVGLRRRNVAAA